MALLSSKWFWIALIWAVSLVVVGYKATAICENKHIAVALKVDNAKMEKRNEIRNHRTNSSDKFLNELWNANDSW